MTIEWELSFIGEDLTYLCILELLLDIFDKGLAFLTDESTEYQLGPDLACSCNSATDGEERPDLFCPQIPNCSYIRQVVESDTKFPSTEAGGSCRSTVLIHVKVFGRIFLDQILQGKTQIGEKSDEAYQSESELLKYCKGVSPIVLIGNCTCKNSLRARQVRKIDIESCELELLHSYNLVNVEMPVPTLFTGTARPA